MADKQIVSKSNELLFEDHDNQPISFIIEAKAQLIADLKEQLKAAEAMVARKPYMITKLIWHPTPSTSAGAV